MTNQPGGKPGEKKWEPRRAIAERLRPKIEDPDPEDTRAIIQRYNLSRIDHRMPLLEYTRETLGRFQFIRAYARAQVTASNNQSAMGMWWVVLNPLLNAMVYWLVFGFILGTARGIDNFIAFLVIGIFVMEFSTQSLSSGTNAITGNLGLVRALQFPRAALPITMVYRESIEHMVSVGVMLVIVLITGEWPKWLWLLLPVAFGLQFLFNLSLAFVGARVGSMVTDFKNVIPFVARVWLFLSGVFYNIKDVTAGLPGWFQWLMEVNPGYVYVEIHRWLLMTDYQMDPRMWLLAVFWAVVPPAR